MIYYFLITFVFLSLSCTPNNKTKQVETQNAKVDEQDKNLIKNRDLINTHVSKLAQALAEQPVMTPRSGFSGYLAHFNVIQSTTKDSEYAVILDGEGYTLATTPSELLSFARLQGAHPYGGTYAFSSVDIKTGAKDRNEPQVRLVLEVPVKKGDGKMAVGFCDGRVITIEKQIQKFNNKTIQTILSEMDQ
jgi:hypothetical protein